MRPLLLVLLLATLAPAQTPTPDRGTAAQATAYDFWVWGDEYKNYVEKQIDNIDLIATLFGNLGAGLKKRVVDVTEPAFGAIGNGSGDDRAAINLALAAGGAVTLPCGTYIISARLTPTSNTTIQGAGRDCTIIKAQASTTWGDTGLIDLGTDALRTGITVRDLTLDGNVANNATGRSYGILCRGCTDLTVDNVALINQPDNGSGNGGDGLLIGKSGTTRPARIKVVNSRFAGNVRQGISITSGKDIQIRGNTIRDTSGTNPGAGIDVEPNGNGAADVVEDLIIDGNSIDGNHYGITVANTNQADVYNLVISANVVRNNDLDGIAVRQIQEGDSVIIASNVIDANGDDGLDISSNANTSAIRVTGNTISRSTGRGISITSTRRYQILGNAVTLNGHHGIEVGYVFNGEHSGEIADNLLMNNGQAASNTYDGLVFTGNASHPNFSTRVDTNTSGNQANLGGNTQRYGINITSDVQNLQLGSNRFTGNGTAAIINSGGTSNRWQGLLITDSPATCAADLTGQRYFDQSLVEVCVCNSAHTSGARWCQEDGGGCTSSTSCG